MKYGLFVALVLSGLAILLVIAAPLPAGTVPESAVDEGDVTYFLPVILSPPPPQTGPFTLIAPADGSQLDTLIPVLEFKANDLGDKTAGCLAYDTEPDPTDCNSSFSVAPAYWERLMWFNLKPNTMYYWRVGAAHNYDYHNIEWSSAQWTFTSGPSGGPIPATPILAAPADFSTVSADVPTLQWQAVDGAKEYEVSVRDEVNGGWYGAREIYPPATQAGEDEIGWIFQLAAGPHYKWSVKARNDYAWGAYANYWHFTLDRPNSRFSKAFTGEFMMTREDGVKILQPAR